jgi:hypothetical protein
MSILNDLFKGLIILSILALPNMALVLKIWQIGQLKLIKMG